MLVITLLSLLLAIPLSSSNISTVQLTRLTSITLFFAAILSFNAYYVTTIGSGLSIYSGLFQVSTVSMAIELFIFIVAGLILIPWASALSGNSNTLTGDSVRPSIPEYSIIILFTTIGASFLISSTDLVSMYLAIELQSFAVYVLAALYRNSESATAAGLKYFLLGALSSAFILLGSALIYGYTGLTNLDAISTLVSVSSSDNVTQGVILGIVIMTVGFLFKIASAPFHNWAPDVYDGVPTIVTTWLAIMPKISIIILLISFHSIAQGLGIQVNDVHINVWQGLLLICSLLSLIIGTVVGLAQVRIKRLFAYSTISHIGFMLLALAITGQESIDALLFYIIQYTITSLNSFFILLAFGYILNSIKTKLHGNNNSDIQFISELKGQFLLNPILSLSMIICLFSMAGIPPLMGFFAKYAVLYTAIHNGYYFISIIAILASVISGAYYLRVVRVLYFDKPTANGINSTDITNTDINRSDAVISSTQVLSSTHCYVIAALTFFIAFFVLQPTLILNCTKLMAMSIYGY